MLHKDIRDFTLTHCLFCIQFIQYNVCLRTYVYIYILSLDNYLYIYIK